MDIQGIDHIELYVGDAQQHAFYLCTTLGFRLVGQGGPETGLAEQRSLLLRQGGIALLLTSALSPDHAAARYVAQHGDGVACVAMRTPDARGAYKDAVLGGAAVIAAPVEYLAHGESVVFAEVGGFGDVRHRFVQREPGSREFLPGAIENLAEDPEHRDELLTTIDHVAVCVPAGELHRTASYYERVFGFRTIFEEYLTVGEQAMDSRVVQSPSEQVTFTLLEPDVNREPGQIDRYLAAHGGAGVQHLAFLTSDIIGAVRTFESRGVRFLDTADSYYTGLLARLGEVDLDVTELRGTGVLVDRDHWGEVFQIFTRSMHVRNTLFLEIIDRHGAKTFGSGNIKALYEAVRTTETPSPAELATGGGAVS